MPKNCKPIAKSQIFSFTWSSVTYWTEWRAAPQTSPVANNCGRQVEEWCRAESCHIFLNPGFFSLISSTTWCLIWHSWDFFKTLLSPHRHPKACLCSCALQEKISYRGPCCNHLRPPEIIAMPLANCQCIQACKVQSSFIRVTTICTITSVFIFN